MNYKKIFLSTTLLASSLLGMYKSASAVENIAILNNPSVEDVSSIGNYILNTTGKPFFDNVVFFAANINGNSPDSAYLYYNEYFNTLLNTESGINAVRKLQALGIKVQIAYLGNYQNAGWSCNMSTSGAQSLANKMVSDINKYGFDGINIDDEYSSCSGNSQAFYNIVKSIKTNSAFKGKILTKNLWSDSDYFYDPYNVAPYLDQGYEMSYYGTVSSLNSYVFYGMGMQQLFLGLSPEYNSAGSVAGISSSVINAGYAGMMVWAPNSFLNQDQAVTYYTNIAQGEYGSNAQVEITGTKLNQELISSSYEDNGIIYAGTEDGLFIFKDNVWNKYTTSNGLLSNYIQKVQVINNVIYVIDAGNAQYSIDNGMSWNSIAKACSDCKFTSINAQGNAIYLGSDHTTYQQGKGYTTQGAYISISTDGNKTWQSTLLDSSIKSIFSLEISGDNLYFIDKKASYKGMLNMSFVGLKIDSTGKFTQLFNESFWSSNPGFISEALNGLAIDKNNSNNIYVATPDGLAVSTNAGKEFILRGQSSGLSSANIYSVAKYNNNLYVGTDAGCFVSYDNGNSFVPFNSDGGYGSNVLDVFANQDDVLVGTNKGIGVYIE